MTGASSPMSFGQKVGVDVVRGKKRAHPFNLRGKFHVLIKDKDGNIKYNFIVDNGITNGGKDDVLSSLFNDATSSRVDWAIGLIDLIGFTGLDDVNDIMSSHTGWVEFTGYSEATRPEWDPGVAASQAITNATPRDFNITSAGTLKGIFISSDDVKSGTTGILWATALFPSDVTVSISDLIKITYTVTA